MVGLTLKTLLKSLLPKKLDDRDALNHESLNIKPRFTRGLRRLSNHLSKFLFTTTLVVFLLGLQPVSGFPPVKQVVTHAHEETIEQKITAEILPVMTLPHPGYLSTPFSRYHPGIDIATGLGMPIHPIADGIVAEVNFSFFGYGNHVTISHQAGFKSLYGHMDRIYIKADQEVSSQDTLGTVGLTGFTSGPHTHLEITRYDKLIDPQTILPEMEKYPNDKLFQQKITGGSIKKTPQPTTKPTPTSDLTNNLPFHSTNPSAKSILLPFPVN